ncbi:hypothetical protein NKG05_08395 [Oerskovia sp. M15]
MTAISTSTGSGTMRSPGRRRAGGSLGGSAPAVFDGEIVVPFSPESVLSGVGRQLQPYEALWYRRTLSLPDGFVPRDGRVLLHFGRSTSRAASWSTGSRLPATPEGSCRSRATSRRR